MDGFLPKPFKLEELVAEYVKSLLSAHSSCNSHEETVGDMVGAAAVGSE